jgi:hypothetical protein
VERTKKTLNDTCDISYLSGDAAGRWSGCILIAIPQDDARRSHVLFRIKPVGAPFDRNEHQILSCRANNLMQNADATVNKGGVRNLSCGVFM